MERTACKSRVVELARKIARTPIIKGRSTATESMNHGGERGLEERGDRYQKIAEHSTARHEHSSGVGGDAKLLRSRPHVETDVVDLRCLLTPAGKKFYFERTAGAGTLRQTVEEFSKQQVRLSLENFLEWVRVNSHLRPFQPNEQPTVGIVYEELLWEFGEGSQGLQS